MVDAEQGAAMSDLERDREQLLLAAKAAGLTLADYQNNEAKGGLWLARECANPVTHSRDWNPLHDDGDALRLATKLRIECGYATLDGKREFATASHPDVDGELWELIEGDETSATRRVIVRAAADIGAAMKE